MNEFLRTGLAAADIARVEALLTQTAASDTAVLVGTWSPTRRVVVVVCALHGAVFHWAAMPAATEAEGQEMARRAFGLMGEMLAAQAAGDVIERARLS